MEKACHDPQPCHSPPSSDQAYQYPAPSSDLSSWPSQYTMNLGNAHSNPTTPNEYEQPFFCGSVSVDYGHSKRPSNGSSMEGSPRNFSNDVMQFVPQAPQSQSLLRPGPIRLYDQRQYIPYSPSGHAPMANLGQPPTPSMHHQQAPTNYMHPVAPMHGGANPLQRMYDFTFSGVDMAPPPSPASPATVNWNNIVYGNNVNPHAYMQTQGIPAGRLYAPPNLLSSPDALSEAIASLAPEQLQQLQRNVGIQAQIQQYAEMSRATYRDDSNPYGAPHGTSTSGLGLDVLRGTTPPSHSTTSTPSLDGYPSPSPTRSPLFEATPPSTGTNGTKGLLTPPSLIVDAMPPRPSPPAISRKKKSPTKPHRSTAANKSISSVGSEGSVNSPDASLDVPFVPLRVRVADLPRDKKIMFERASGNLWDPKSTSNDHESGLSRSEVQLLEDIYALLSSHELKEQLEIPDELVEPLLETILLPRADAHRGSRGGAAGHLCQWYGCGKIIKRLDHSRNHIREHCKSKPHTCGGPGSKGCGQTFLRTDDLKRHQKSHCSVLRSGPGRRPRSIRGTRRGTDEEEERDSDLTSIDGGGDDDDDYRPVVISAPGTTRELVSRLRRERRRTIRYVAGDSTEESDTGVESGWLQTSNVRHTVESPICGEDGLAEI